MVKVITGWNCDEETQEILKELKIPKNKTSETVNKIIKEWHNQKKQIVTEKLVVRSRGEVIGIKI